MSITKILYIYWKILGVFPFDLTDNGVIRLSYCGTIYSLILAICYSVCYTSVITDRLSFALPRSTPMAILANLGGLSIDFALLLSTWLYFGYRLKHLRRIINRSRNIDVTFASNGMLDNDKRFFREFAFHAIMVNVIWGLVCTLSFNILINFEPSKLTVWMILNTLRIVNHSIVFMFVNAMRFVKKRFRSLNEKIRDFPNESSKGMTIRGEIRQNGLFETFATSDPLEIYGRIHSDLVELATIVVEFFSLSVLLALLSECIQMASGLYTLCLITKGTTSHLVLIAWILWFLVYLTEMIILVIACDATDKEANRTGNVLHEMSVTGGSAKYVGSVTVLSLRLLQKQFKIELFGLVRIRFDIIYRIMSMLGVYITIMMQLDNQNVPDP